VGFGRLKEPKRLFVGAAGVVAFAPGAGVVVVPAVFPKSPPLGVVGVAAAPNSPAPGGLFAVNC
jgi:hypothetical protein